MPEWHDLTNKTHRDGYTSSELRHAPNVSGAHFFSEPARDPPADLESDQLIQIHKSMRDHDSEIFNTAHQKVMFVTSRFREVGLASLSLFGI